MENPLCPPADPGFALIETMRWTPGGGIAHRARHMARLARTARALGITPRGVSSALDAITSSGPLRVRLTVDAEGRTNLTSAPFQALGPDARWRVAIHPQRLDAADPWLRHKTTRRAVYDAARAALPRGIDEWIFLNEGGAVCEGTITNIHIRPAEDAALLTPPRACGLLPGIGREVLIASRRARPARLTLQDLEQAHAIYVGNALRGLIRAELVSSC
ncbi:4-amino-4-deoxychorismate lyase [Pelagivirga sediminicola]|uniref:Probable branched-chain-amino-acid aminotransferase n=1 Tax=Pelagivirga sediminicola TaxID=2170575 RepID=A0A2T7GAF0_9RHOB|nr:aminotransferase class IV family protein [Pelagivirga sediminicola]PVA11400.1 4-amino-4-deoxychorismate lyase [Pelagivirga sediminicola]